MVCKIKEMLFFCSAKQMVEELNINFKINTSIGDYENIKNILNTCKKFKNNKYVLIYNDCEEIFEIYKIECQ